MKVPNWFPILVAMAGTAVAFNSTKECLEALLDQPLAIAYIPNLGATFFYEYNSYERLHVLSLAVRKCTNITTSKMTIAVEHINGMQNSLEHMTHVYPQTKISYEGIWPEDTVEQPAMLKNGQPRKGHSDAEFFNDRDCSDNQFDCYDYFSRECCSYGGKSPKSAQLCNGNDYEERVYTYHHHGCRIDGTQEPGLVVVDANKPGPCGIPFYSWFWSVGNVEPPMNQYIGGNCDLSYKCHDPRCLLSIALVYILVAFHPYGYIITI